MTGLFSTLSVLAAGEPSVPEEALRTASAVLFALSALGAAALLLVGCRLALHPPAPPWIDRVRRVCSRSARGRDLLELAAAIAACQGLFFFAIWPLARPLLSPDAAPGVALIGQTVCFHGVVLVWAAVRSIRKGRETARLFGMTRHGISHDIAMGGIVYLLFLPAVLLGSLLWQWILLRLNLPSPPQTFLTLFGEPASPAREFYLVFLAVLLAPVAEEIVFRGLLLPWTARRIGAARAVLLLSAAFAGIHFHLPSFVPLFLISIGFSMAYLWSGSLGASMAMHSFFNSANMGLFLTLVELEGV
jgi:membrane protease YdiL (CAAX protease family)